MKEKLKITLITVLFLSTLKLFGQTFEVDTLLFGGPINNRINIVLLGDGYTSLQQNKFLTDANALVSALLTTQPYKEYKNYINVMAVKVVSNQSGATHAGISSDNSCGSQPIEVVDNYFGSTFDGSIAGGSYHRLLVPNKNSAILNVLATNTPYYDQVLILVNTPYYGGSGGTFATSSTHSSALEICIHEVGHSFAKLGDEYWAGSIYAYEKPNMTANSNTATVKWKNWVGFKTVGAYQYPGGAGWYRPVNGKCKMEYLGISYPFCPVCVETHILKYLDLMKPYDDYSPSNSSILSALADINFSLTNVLPEPNTLKISWKLNGTTINASGSNYTLPINTLNKTGTNTLQAIILDTTALLRSDIHATNHTFTISWSLNYSLSTGFDVTSREEDLIYRIYPNPATKESVIEFGKMENNSSIELQLINELGIIVSFEKMKNEKKLLSIGRLIESKKSGVYNLIILRNGLILGEEKIVIE